MTTNPLQPYT